MNMFSFHFVGSDLFFIAFYDHGIIQFHFHYKPAMSNSILMFATIVANESGDSPHFFKHRSTDIKNPGQVHIVLPEPCVDS